MFFNNCYYWLVPNGYLILHLVDRNKYDPVVPIAKPPFVENPQKYSQTRITKSVVDFQEYQYKSDIVFPENITVIVNETFADNSGHIRKNENTLYMESIETILKIAMRRGFIVHSKTNMVAQNGDENQFIYILERTM